MPETSPKGAAAWLDLLRQLDAGGRPNPDDLLSAAADLGIAGSPEAREWIDTLKDRVTLGRPIAATTASGIARATLIRHLSLDPAIRRLFAELGQQTGVIHRIAGLRERADGQGRDDRDRGLMPGWEARLEAATGPWLPLGSPAPVDIPSSIALFLAPRSLNWPWLATSTTGAFTWFVDDVVSALIRSIGSPWEDRHPKPVLPTPLDPPRLDESWWNEDDGPRLTEDRAFGPIRLYRNDSIELARARVHTYLVEIAAYLDTVARPKRPPGQLLDKRRETVVRNVGWFYRSEVLKEVSLNRLAKEEFAATEVRPQDREAISQERRKDVRVGIVAAKKLLEETPFGQPIVTLEEYERGRIGI